MMLVCHRVQVIVQVVDLPFFFLDQTLHLKDGFLSDFGLLEDSINLLIQHREEFVASATIDCHYL